MIEKPIRTHHDERGYGTHETISMFVTSVSSLKLQLKVSVESKNLSLWSFEHVRDSVFFILRLSSQLTAMVMAGQLVSNLHFFYAI